MKLHVDAVNLEAMVAFGKQVDLFTIIYIRETGCTLKATVFFKVFVLKDGNGEGTEDGKILRESGLVGSKDESTRAERANGARVAFGTEVEDEDDDEDREDRDKCCYCYLSAHANRTANIGVHLLV